MFCVAINASKFFTDDGVEPIFQFALKLFEYKISEVLLFGGSVEDRQRLYRVLHYLDCPPSLRGGFYVLEPTFRKMMDRYAARLPELPHHAPGLSERHPYVRGMVVEDSSLRAGSAVKSCLNRHLYVDKKLPPGTQVTVKVVRATAESRRPEGFVVPAAEPCARAGVYWGFKLRQVESAFELFLGHAAMPGGFDLVVNVLPTHKRDIRVKEALPEREEGESVLVVYGTLEDLDARDDKLMNAVGNNVVQLVDSQIHLRPTKIPDSFEIFL